MIKDEVKLVMKRIIKKAKTHGVKHPPDLIAEIQQLCIEALDAYEKQKDCIDQGVGFVTDETNPDVVAYFIDGNLTDFEKHIMETVGRHLVEGNHPLTHEIDVMASYDFIAAFRAITPHVPFFANAHINSKEAIRRMGAVLGKSNSRIEKRTGNYYLSVEERRELNTKATSRSVTLWIVRNHKKYRNMGPADLYREYERQRRYAYSKLAEQQEQQKLVSNVSFL